MKEHFIHELNRLLQRVYRQGENVEKMARNAVTAFGEANAALAEHVLKQEANIDTEEILIEEECLKILALYQPVAGDLRTIISYLKINSALERIADFACHLAERAIHISTMPATPPKGSILSMAELALGMLHNTLEVLLRENAVLAGKVIAQDDALDTWRHDIRNFVRNAIPQEPAQADFYIEYAGAARDLERMGDLASDICEHIIYLRTGRIIRHGGK